MSYFIIKVLITLQISDDEDDTHPNIHTPSLFKWKHEARVERMEKVDIERRLLDKERST